MERDVNPISLISKKERTRMLNTLLKVKFQAMAIQLPVSVKRKVPYVPFSGNFH